MLRAARVRTKPPVQDADMRAANNKVILNLLQKNLVRQLFLALRAMNTVTPKKKTLRSGIAHRECTSNPTPCIVTASQTGIRRGTHNENNVLFVIVALKKKQQIFHCASK